MHKTQKKEILSKESWYRGKLFEIYLSAKYTQKEHRYYLVFLRKRCFCHLQIKVKFCAENK